MAPRVRERLCPRCMTKGAHAMGCPEPAIRRAAGAVQAVLDVKPHILDDALDGVPVEYLDALEQRLRASVERRAAKD